MNGTVAIPVMKPRLPDADAVAPWLRLMDASGIYSNYGPLVSMLERRYAEFFGVGAEQVVTVANATLGIEGAVSVLPASVWQVPAFTFAATGHAVNRAGASVEFADVDRESWALPAAETLDASEGLLPVLPFGAPVEWRRWAWHPTVIIDAAASMGAAEGRLGGLPPGWAVVFSLHATKVLPAGEGGLVVFGSEDDARALRRWTNFGFDAARISVAPGTNAKMSEIHAAYALASLERGLATCRRSVGGGRSWRGNDSRCPSRSGCLAKIIP